MARTNFTVHHGSALQMGEVAFSGKLGKAAIAGRHQGRRFGFLRLDQRSFRHLRQHRQREGAGLRAERSRPQPAAGRGGHFHARRRRQAYTGAISAVSIGSVSVAGDVRGAAGHESGFIQGGASLGTVQIGGSLIGGNLVTTYARCPLLRQRVSAGPSNPSRVGKNIYGGSGLDSGQISSTGLMQSAIISGDIVGGSAGQTNNGGLRHHRICPAPSQRMPSAPLPWAARSWAGTWRWPTFHELGHFSGSMVSETSIGKLVVGKNMQGGSGSNSGAVLAKDGNLASIMVGGANAGGWQHHGRRGVEFSGEIGVTGSSAPPCSRTTSWAAPG